MTTLPPINLAGKLSALSEYWSPRVVAEMNDYQFKLVKLKGKFVWHTHDDTDETFLALAGELEIGLRTGAVALKVGEMYVVPKGVEHITRAERECHALVIEPRGIVITGNAGKVPKHLGQRAAAATLDIGWRRSKFV